MNDRNESKYEAATRRRRWWLALVLAMGALATTVAATPAPGSADEPGDIIVFGDKPVDASGVSLAAALDVGFYGPCTNRSGCPINGFGHTGYFKYGTYAMYVLWNSGLPEWFVVGNNSVRDVWHITTRMDVWRPLSGRRDVLDMEGAGYSSRGEQAIAVSLLAGGYRCAYLFPGRWSWGPCGQ